MMMTNTMRLIDTAVSGMREESVRRSQSAMLAKIEAFKAKGRYDYPKLENYKTWTPQGRGDYKRAVADYHFAARLFKSTSGDSYMANEQVVEALLAEAKAAAEKEYEAYIYKLGVQKLTRPVKAVSLLSRRDVWTESTLKVELEDGTVELWRTQMILNFSVLGTPYNQFPTRQVKK